MGKVQEDFYTLIEEQIQLITDTNKLIETNALNWHTKNCPTNGKDSECERLFLNAFLIVMGDKIAEKQAEFLQEYKKKEEPQNARIGFYL